MHAYVSTYTRLERQATGAESKVDEYRQRIEACRWEQCRLAHEATESGDFTQVAFSAAVGKSATTIKRQVAAWRTYGSHATRPSYGEAMAGAVGTTADAENGRKRLSTARAVLSDPDVMRELLADPRVRMATSRALKEQPPSTSVERDGQRPPPSDELIIAMGRFVKRLNGERRDGQASARDVRLAARRCRSFGEVLDRVAARGLDDDELETLVSLEVFGRPHGRRAPVAA